MNDTSIKAKELVEQVKKLKPEVVLKKQNAEIKSTRAKEEEQKANVVLQSQTKVKEEVERRKVEASEFLSKCNVELKEAEKFKIMASHAVEKLREEAIREVSNYKLDIITKMSGVKPVLDAVLLIVNGKANINDLKNTLSRPKNLKQFDLNLIETEFEKFRKICNTYKAW